MRYWELLKQRLFTPVDASSIAVFRIGFGFIMAWDAWRYYAKGWVQEYYIEPEFYFKYFGFQWVQPWEGDGMLIHFAVMGVCAFLVMIGAFYRIAIITFTLAFIYVFLLDQTRYLNHFYLVILFSVLLCVIPAHRRFSVDAWLRPKLRSATLPAWTLWLLRVQMEIVLIFAGIVKINPDWLQLQPLKMWLAEHSDFPYGLGYLFTQDWSVAMAAYGVILLHIVGAPLLLYKRTRLAVFCLYAAFHLLNHFVFYIGIFPWFTLFASLLFFEPDWPKRLSSWLRRKFPSDGTAVGMDQTKDSPVSVYTTPAAQQHLTLAFVVLWSASQIFIPLRHVLYPGNVSWTKKVTASPGK
jgi:vitamin K-dependent gamma-carboxylase